MPQITPLQRVLTAAAGSAAGKAVCLFALDNECAHIARIAKEPVVAQIRLAWWRDGLSAKEPLPQHRSPEMDALRELEGFERIRQSLIAMINGWEDLILFDGNNPGAMLAAYGQGRGGGFFAAFGAGDDEYIRIAGSIWALWDLAGHLSDNDLADRAVALGQDMCGELGARAVGRPRMLAMMASIARADLKRGKGSASGLTPRLYLRLLRAQILGR